MLQHTHHLSQAVYQACKRVFSQLPLAALVAGRTLVLHGGLFRKPRKGIKKRKRWGMEPEGTPRPSKGWLHRLPSGGRHISYGRTVAAEQLGSLKDLRASSKGGMDPNGTLLSLLCLCCFSTHIVLPVLFFNPYCSARPCCVSTNAPAGLPHVKAPI